MAGAARCGKLVRKIKVSPISLGKARTYSACTHETGASSLVPADWRQQTGARSRTLIPDPPLGSAGLFPGESAGCPVSLSGLVRRATEPMPEP